MNFPNFWSLIAICLLLALSTRSQAESADVAAMLQKATQESGAAQYAAIDDLGELHTSDTLVVPKLQGLLASKDAQVRWRAARALGDYGQLAGSAASGLRGLLADPDPVVQYHAAAALGRIGDKSDATVDALVKLATGKDARVARAAIAALRVLQPGPQRVMAVLEKTLSSDDQAVVLYAMEAIVERGKEATPLLNVALQRPKTAYIACAAIEQIGPDAAATAPALAELLGKTKHSKLQIQAMLALASIGPGAKAAAPKIVPLLAAKDDATVPVAAAYALGSIRAADANSQAALRTALTQENAFLQMIAAWALAKLNPHDEAAVKLAVDKLAHGLTSDDPALRTAAAKGLHLLQAPPELVAPHMVAIVNDPDPDVRANAVNAIASLGEAVVPRVVRALENPELRGPAVQVLTRLGPKAAAAVQPLVDAAAGAEPDLRAEIYVALAAIGPAAAPATGVLAEAIASDNQSVRESALYALKQIGPPANAASDALVKRMQADDSFDALASAWALARIAPMDAAIAEAAVPKLIGGLSSTDDPSRLESAEALAAFGPAAASAVAELQRVAKGDSVAEVRGAADAALARITSR